MAACPTGVLVEISNSPATPKKPPKQTLEELLKELGIKYSLITDAASGKSLPAAKWRLGTQTKKPSSPCISEDDFITNEVFDFFVPSFEELDLPECDQKRSVQTVRSDLVLDLPLLSVNTASEGDWNYEVTVEAKKISKRLSMKIEVPLSTSDFSNSGSGSSVDVGDKTYTMLSSAKSSDGDDKVFFSPAPKRKLTTVSRGKENKGKQVSSPTFVPNKNPEEALTPEGVRRIKGPLLRRGTFTMDTPKTAGRPQLSTPKTVERSKSLARTPEVGPKISTFRKGESPQVVERRRSSSLGRPSLNNTSVTRPLQLVPQRSNVGAPSPLLRKALLPKVQSRPTSLVNSSITARGPIRALVPGTSRDPQPSSDNKQKPTISAGLPGRQSQGRRSLLHRTQMK